MSANYFKYWGKVSKSTEKNSVKYYLLPYHCLDVAAVAEVWLTESNTILKQISSYLKTSNKKTKQIILFYILHQYSLIILPVSLIQAHQGLGLCAKLKARKHFVDKGTI